MFLRVFGRLQKYKYIRMWKILTVPSIDSVLRANETVNYTSFCKRHQHNSKETGLFKEESDTSEKDLSTMPPENYEGRVIKKNIHALPRLYPSKQLTKTAQIFETVAMDSLNEEGFRKAIEEFQKKDLKRLKLIDFISTAMAYMDQFGVSKNVDIYNKLLDIFPKGRYHNRNVFDTLWTRYRPQIDCAIHLLTKLEDNGIRPNVNTYDIIEAIFGEDSIPMNKLKRIVFWFDKFDIMYPHPLPKNLPTDKLDLFELAIKRMIGKEASVSVYKNSDQSAHPLIVGTENKNLLHLLEGYDESKPLFVEGPYVVWLRKIKIYYYILQADLTPCMGRENDFLALCIFENGGEKEVKLWINELQKAFPTLANLNVVFNISRKRKD